MAFDIVARGDVYAAWLREQAANNRPYWYGCYYLPCTEALLQKKKKQYPNHYAESRMARYREDIAAGQICGDCVNGAIKGAVWSELGTREPVYASHGCPDTNADGMFARCKNWGMDWGEISTIPDEPGVAVRMSGHVGVYVGDGDVVEWRGFGYGCVVTKLKNRRWKHWYKLPWIEYAAGSAIATETGARTLKKGATGDDVKALQERLMALGYSLPQYGADGEYGAETEAAVKRFQADRGLEADGIAGEKTLAALETDARVVRIVDCESCRVRQTPGTDGATLGFLQCGAALPYGGETVDGWVAVTYKGVKAYVSGKYGKVE